MPEQPLKTLLPYAILLAVVALVGARWLDRQQDSSTPPPAAAGNTAISVKSAQSGRATVHVAGEVRRPGVYRLPAVARVEDAVARAGGPTRRADLTQINLAAEVEDGRQILVPAGVVSGDEAAGAAPTAVAPGAGTPLNLNTATLEQLDALDGIGPQTAQQILDYRDEHDGFGSVEELGDVPGIGDKRMASLREQVRV